MPVPKGTRVGGRQKGTPNKATADIKALAREHTPEAMTRLVEIIRESDSDSAVVAAIRELFDRGFGKPKQSVDIEATLESYADRLKRIRAAGG